MKRLLRLTWKDLQRRRRSRFSSSLWFPSPTTAAAPLVLSCLQRWSHCFSSLWFSSPATTASPLVSSCLWRCIRFSSSLWFSSSTTAAAHLVSSPAPLPPLEASHSAAVAKIRPLLMLIHTRLHSCCSLISNFRLLALLLPRPPTQLPHRPLSLLPFQTPGLLPLRSCSPDWR